MTQKIYGFCPKLLATLTTRGKIIKDMFSDVFWHSKFESEVRLPKKISGSWYIKIVVFVCLRLYEGDHHHHRSAYGRLRTISRSSTSLKHSCTSWDTLGFMPCGLLINTLSSSSTHPELCNLLEMTLWEAFAPHLSVSDTLEPSDQTLTCGVYITCIEWSTNSKNTDSMVF